MVPRACCEAGMTEVETEGVTTKLINLGPDERGENIVTGYRCVECDAKWLRVQKTEYPDSVVWKEVL